MRALAIIMVLSTHLLWVFPDLEGTFISFIRLMGVMGVELFFVLSGYLIGHILIKIVLNDNYKPTHLLYFLIRRWFKTFPNYYLVLIINIFIALYFGRHLPKTLALYFGYIQNFNFGMDIFFTESWSLPIEEFAYLIAPILLFVTLKWVPKKQILNYFFGITIIVIITFLGTKYSYHLREGATTLQFWNINLKAVVIYRLDAIYYGVLAALLSFQFKNNWIKFKHIYFFIGLFLFSILHLFIIKFQLNPEKAPLLYNVFYLPLCSISFSFLLPLLSQLKKAPNYIFKSITFLSIISYAVYLLHYSVVLQLLHYHWQFGTNTIVLKVLFMVVYLSTTLCLSYLLYRYFERPIMNLRDHPKLKNIFKDEIQ